MKDKFKLGQKIIHIPTNKVYDFGYYTKMPGMCVIYEQGKHNFENSLSVKVESIRATFKWKTTTG